MRDEDEREVKMKKKYSDYEINKSISYLEETKYDYLLHVYLKLTNEEQKLINKIINRLCNQIDKFSPSMALILIGALGNFLINNERQLIIPIEIAS